MNTTGMNLEVMIEKPEKSLLIVGSYNDFFLESSEFRHTNYIMQQNKQCYTCYGNVFLGRFLHFASHPREAAIRNHVILTT